MIDYLRHVAGDAERLGAAAAAAGLDAAVPSCPGWSVRDLVRHTGKVHREKEQIVRERRSDAPPPIEPPGDDELLEWFRAGAAALVATLSATDPATPVWTWYDADQSAGFWCRRMAHETVIHRVDAELSSGEESIVDEDLAHDGIDEILVVMMTSVADWATVTPRDGTVRLAVPGGSWSVRRAYLSGTSPHSGNTYTDLEMASLVADTGDADCTVRGSAADLDLWLWGRGPLDRLEVDGNVALAHWLRERAVEDTQ